MVSNVKKLQRAILSWYKTNGRDLPWRHTTDPYKIMVSEVMLQQTQASRVVPKYEAWLKQFPTFKTLAEAPAGDILRAWSGLGYNRRAIALQRAAQKITRNQDRRNLSRKSAKDWQELPGIGSYTAAAICSFAFNADVPLVDTNIKRFYQLIHFGDAVEPTEKQLREVALKYLPKGHSRNWHSALMDIITVINRGRGAKVQQEKLIELLPALKEFNLPPVSTERLKRPKQSDFKASRRYWRGKIIHLLLRYKKLSRKRLNYYLNEYENQPCPYSFDKLIAELEKDNLVEIRKESILLPR